MPATPRVFMDSIHTQADAGFSVTGFELGLGKFGPEKGGAAPESRPAVLSFHVAFFELVRGVGQPVFEKFASLAGQLTTTGTELEPLFICDDPVEITYEAGEPAERGRRLTVAFDQVTVQGAAGAQPPVLVLPQAPPKARFVELAVELEVDGTVEAAVAVNDRLDIPLGVRSFFRVRVVDAAQQPLLNVPFVLSLADGKQTTGTTNDLGIVEVADVPPGACELTLPEE